MNKNRLFEHHARRVHFTLCLVRAAILFGMVSHCMTVVAKSRSERNSAKTEAEVIETVPFEKRFSDAAPKIEQGALAWSFVSSFGKEFETRAKMYEDESKRAQKVRERRGSDRKSRVELKYEWLSKMAALLTEMGQQKRLVEIAKYQDPLAPPIDATDARQRYLELAEEFAQVRLEPAKRRKKKR